MNTFKVEMRGEMKKLIKLQGSGSRSSASDTHADNSNPSNRLGNSVVEFSSQVQKMETQLKGLQS